MNPQTYAQQRFKMSNTSKVIGICAIVISVLFPTAISLFISFGLGFMAVMLAFLSKGYEHKMDRNAKMGTILGVSAILVSLIIGAVSLFVLLSNPEQLKETLKYAETLYGEDFDQDYGAMINEILGDLTNE